jgi:hypothetical protein
MPELVRDDAGGNAGGLDDILQCGTGFYEPTCSDRVGGLITSGPSRGHSVSAENVAGQQFDTPWSPREPNVPF